MVGPAWQVPAPRLVLLLCCGEDGVGGMQSKPVLGRELHPAHGGLWSLADGTSPGWWLEA